MSKSSNPITEIENENQLLHVPSPPSRSPLNTIPDPRQQSANSSFSEKKLQLFDISQTKPIGIGSTPRVLPRLRSHSDSNAAQSTPARSLSRASNAAPMSASTLNPLLHKGSCSLVSRGLSVVNSGIELPHFELVDHPSFWKDHNVQVLIRVRPLSSLEKVTQGYGRCLKQESAQTVAWLGHPETRFTFDHVACEAISQEKLFRVAGLPMVENCMSGYNSCMFAYGQTGSGKTYTMMGEINQVDGELNKDCGITPRVFEYLFTRIKAEQENRGSEGLKYSCKCSFLEIYNEQITDLLEPSSTNLQIREDTRKGVYVENLSEYDVQSVDDVLNLLREGAANRKISATHMNDESSRSHSVFTCIIESRWEKESMSHLRFARLNLVDLAGSERQKSSGAEGDRLKEAATINRSLSTLGCSGALHLLEILEGGRSLKVLLPEPSELPVVQLVIMSLVDLAHGKHRHVPYRDSRLTFLLQDSLGGNSKTTIIANVSPSICSANETLSTLKFAQRAKLIQNNAKVNEDASSDVSALRWQIQQLKCQLNSLMKHQDTSNCLHTMEEADSSDFPMRCNSTGEVFTPNNSITTGHEGRKVDCLKTLLLGALRREKLAGMEIRRLKTELEQANSLINLCGEDAQHDKRILAIREKRIKELELNADGLLSADKQLFDENHMLKEEIRLLQERINDHPEMTKVRLENIRLHQQLRLVQDFYVQGGRETLLAELSELRDQFLEVLETEGSPWQFYIAPEKYKQNNGAKEVDDRRDMNSTLMWEVDDLQREMVRHIEGNHNAFDMTETLTTKSIGLEDITSCNLPEEQLLFSGHGQTMNNIRAFQCNDVQKQLAPLQKENYRLARFLHKNEMLERHPGTNEQSSLVERQAVDAISRDSENVGVAALQEKLDKMSKDLQEALLLNNQYSEDHASRLSLDQQIEVVRDEVELETAKTILLLQEELVVLQSEFEKRLCILAEENTCLRKILTAKDDKMRALSAQWERATLELTGLLLDGSKSLEDANRQIEGISSSFPLVNVRIEENIQRVVKLFTQKEDTILSLQDSLEEAQKTVLLMSRQLNALKDVTVAWTEAELTGTVDNNQPDQLIRLPNGGSWGIEGKWREELNNDFAQCTFAACSRKIIPEGDKLLTDVNALVALDVDYVPELARQGHLEAEYALNAVCSDTETLVSMLQSDNEEAVSVYKELLQDLETDISETKRSYSEIRANSHDLKIYLPRDPACVPHSSLKHVNQQKLLHQIKDELVKTNDRLNAVNACMYMIVNSSVFPVCKVDRGEADRLHTECLFSCSNHSAERDASACISNRVHLGIYKCPSGTEEKVELENGEKSISIFHPHDSERLDGAESQDTTDILLVCLRREFRSTYEAFSKLRVLFNGTFNENHMAMRFSPEAFPLIDTDTGSFQDGYDQLTVSEECQDLIIRGSSMDLKNATFCGSQLDAGDIFTQGTSFFTKIEEAHATMKEADNMLKALLKANENAKQQTYMWTQAKEGLETEKACLLQDIQQLKSSTETISEVENGLQDKIFNTIIGIKELIASLEEAFGYMQKDVEEMYKVVYHDASVIVQETLNWTRSSRIVLENMYTKELENVIMILFLESYVKELSNELGRIDRINALCELSLPDEPNEMKKDGETNERFGNRGILYFRRKEQCVGEIAPIISEAEALSQIHGDPVCENMELKRELERKELLLKGLLFDFRLLQESAAYRKDVKDEFDKLFTTLNQVQYELQIKTGELDDLLIKHQALQGHLSKTENELTAMKSDLELVRKTSSAMSQQNADLKVLVKNLLQKKSELEEQLKGQMEVVKNLEDEIVRQASSTDKQLASSMEAIEIELERVTGERDELLEQLQSLRNRLDMMYALADEKEAIAIEARQESEKSKLYAEQKEEEVNILECSIEELECTINVMETRVYEMEEEVQRQHMMNDALELEIQALRKRLSMVEILAEKLDSENSSVELSMVQIPRSLEHYDFQIRTRLHEEEKADLVKEISKCKEYMSELILHAEAQASQFQEKYKCLEQMVLDAKTELPDVTCGVATLDETVKSSMRTRGSSSPFRCITNLVQQVNLEKYQELSSAKLRIKELEELAVDRQKEVCVLTSRLAAAENMTHDVIRDLLGVKLDMENFADLAEQYQLQKLVEEAQQQQKESFITEGENSNLRRQIIDLIEERKRCILEISRREADALATQMTVEKLKERDQLLTAQNEMLKVDKTSLQQRVAELDYMAKTIFGKQEIRSRKQQTIDSSVDRTGDCSRRRTHLGKKLT